MRIRGVSPDRARPRVRVVSYFVRRGLAKETGRDSEEVLRPLRLYALVPVLFNAYVHLERATARLRGLDRRLRALAELKAATLTRCAYCIDLGSAVAHRWGLSPDELRALPDHRSSPLFSDLDKLVLEYAVAMSRTPVDVPDTLFDRLRRHLDERQIVELTHVIALENLRGRFNRALGVGSSGLSDATVCAVPSAGHPTTYRFYRNRRHPAFRLVLRTGDPVPPETAESDWEMTREREEHDVNPDLLTQIHDRGYALFSLNADLAQIPVAGER